MHAINKPEEPLARGSRLDRFETPEEEIPVEEMLSKPDEIPYKLTMLFLGSFGAVPCTWKKPRELYQLLVYLVGFLLFKLSLSQIFPNYT